MGDSVGVHRLGGKGLLKGADLHILIKEDERPKAAPCIIVAGVAEVKSYFRSERRMNEQLDKHIRRAKRGLEVTGENYSAERVNIGFGPNRRVVRIAVLPSEWALPRTFKFKSSKNGRVLNVEKGVPHCKSDEIREIGRDVWRITLRWSKEALAAVAYEMTFWYMDKVGEVIYGKQRPKAWGKMSPGEAGRNAAKMMLYYALLRCGSDRESERAIALYNSYGFGYALGMNYRNEKGKREMLWPQDLDEILSAGKTKSGCILR